MAETRFVETEALLAAMRGDEQELERLLVGMLPGERASLARAAGRLADAAKSFCGGCRNGWSTEEG